MNSHPEWQLPTGTSRGVWTYLNDANLARQYDQSLAGTALIDYDLRIAGSVFKKPGDLVDLGCGTGRLLVPFARSGHSVLGVDLSAEMLMLAAEKAVAAGLDTPLVRANLVELECLRDACFDYAACLFSTLGMISGIEHRRAALGHVFRILKPGGQFLLHVHNLWFHFWTKAGRRWLLRDRWRRLIDAPDAGDYEMPTHQGISGLALHHFSLREICRLVRSAGFRMVRRVPVSLRSDCRLPAAWLFPSLRAYGFLLVLERPRF